MFIPKTIDKPISVLDALRDLARRQSGDKISLDSFTKGLGRRSYGFLLLTLNLPNMIPLPLPLLSVFFGLPLALVGLQLALGVDHPWMPGFITKRGIKKDELLSFCDQVDARYGWFHRLLRPRLPVLTRGWFVRCVGLAIFVLAATMALPIPLGNLVLAIPISILSLGLIERDGVFVMAGLILGFGGLLFNLLIGSSILIGMWMVIEHFLGGA